MFNGKLILLHKPTVRTRACARHASAANLGPTPTYVCTSKLAILRTTNERYIDARRTYNIRQNIHQLSRRRAGIHPKSGRDVRMYIDRPGPGFPKVKMMSNGCWYTRPGPKVRTKGSVWASGKKEEKEMRSPQRLHLTRGYDSPAHNGTF